MDIKDDLHFYIGCEGIFKGYENFKPILRPLSDMTEEEKVCVFKIVSLFDLSECEFEFGDNWVNAVFKGRVIDAIQFIGANIESMNNDGTFSAINKISKVINWCRKNGFDTDGLIDAGLAIDKTKLK